MTAPQPLDVDVALSKLMLDVLGIARKYNLPTVSPKAMNDELDAAYHKALADSHHWATQQRIDELDVIDDKLYDIGSSEWGIPTKWSIEKSGNENYADLWSPNEAIHEVVKRRKAELEATLKGEEHG